MALVDVELARSNMMDDRLITRTHLGFILSPGDLVLGYDFRTLSIDEELLKSYKNYQLPDVVCPLLCLSSLFFFHLQDQSNCFRLPCSMSCFVFSLFVRIFEHLSI